MADHVRILAVLNIVFGAIGALAALLMLVLFGGIAGIVGMSGEPDAAIAVPVLGAIGGVLFVVILVLSLPCIVAGAGLLKFRPWARILVIVISALNLLNVPLGTALGIYGLWVLLHQDTVRLFGVGQSASA